MHTSISNFRAKYSSANHKSDTWWLDWLKRLVDQTTKYYRPIDIKCTGMGKLDWLNHEYNLGGSSTFLPGVLPAELSDSGVRTDLAFITPPFRLSFPAKTNVPDSSDLISTRFSVIVSSYTKYEPLIKESILLFMFKCSPFFESLLLY